MSIDLDWSALDAQLTLACTRFLADALDRAPTPDFLGPLTVTHFSFGDAQPEITLRDIRDIQHEFLDPHPDDDDELDPDPDPGAGDNDGGTGGNGGPRYGPAGERGGDVTPWHEPDDRASERRLPSLGPGSSIAAANAAALLSSARLHQPHPGAVGLAALALHPHSRFPSPRGGGLSRSHSPSQPTHPHSYHPPSPSPSRSSWAPGGRASAAPPPSSAPSPSLQVHLGVAYSGNLSLGIATSLRINYPAPGFMTLPLSLTLTGLALHATLVVAYEGSPRRIHLSLIESEFDPNDDDDNNNNNEKNVDPSRHTHAPTPGARLLRFARVESEVGQADKHVLRNVGKVEKFVVDVARRTLENELVFPNFQTILF